MREREGGSSTIQFRTRHSFLLKLYGETLFEFISPPEFRQNKKRSKRRIPPQTPPPPLATSEFRKKESAEVLRNPFPRKLFPQNFVRFVSDFLIGIAFKKGSNFVQQTPPKFRMGFGSEDK